MATTLRTVVYDLLTSFHQVADDSDIQASQVAHWVIMFGNKLKMQHIGKRDSGAFLSIFGDIQVQEFTTLNNPNEIPGRKYIELPASIFDYDKDGGIEYISYYVDYEEKNCPPPFTRQLFARTTPSETRRLYMGDYEKPSPSNPFFYRVSGLIYLLGIECIKPKSLEIGLYSTLKPVTDADFDLDAVFDFPEELLITLKKNVLDLGRFVMMVPKERVNDGSDLPTESAPMNKLVSVNEGNEDITQNK